MSESRFSVDLTLQEGYRFAVAFGQEGVADLVVDEPAPLRRRAPAPTPARLLAAAVANCMSASLLFCLRLPPIHVDVAEMHATVEGEMVRNERGRMRIGALRVRLSPGGLDSGPSSSARLADSEIFEDFCTVGQSVRQGIDVSVVVDPTPLPVGVGRAE